MRVLITAAMRQELAQLQACLPATSSVFLCTGIGCERTARAIRQQISAFDLIINTGCCGALDSRLQVGDLVLPDRVLAQQQSGIVTCPDPDAGWRQKAITAAEHLHEQLWSGPLLSVDAPLNTAASKRIAREQSAALAVDMETAAVAIAASEAGRPYLSLRFVLDSAEEEFSAGTKLTKNCQLARIAAHAPKLSEVVDALLKNAR